ncbi:MAG: translation elongation factor Ts [bacterium]
MNISASLVKQLRERTGVGLMACKDALTKADGNIDDAVKWLREKGLASASKKASRDTSEGRVFIANEGNKAVILELNCETDFVASSHDFVSFGETLSTLILNSDDIQTLEDLKNKNVFEKTFDQAVADLILKVGENIQVGKFEKLESENSIATYMHSNFKIAALVSFNQSVESDIAKDIAMQVVAARPRYVTPANVPEEEKAKEKAIIVSQLSESGKPADLIEKIAEGKLNKFFKEICLMEQPFIKDDKKSIKQLVPTNSVNQFICFALV